MEQGWWISFTILELLGLVILSLWAIRINKNFKLSEKDLQNERNFRQNFIADENVAKEIIESAKLLDQFCREGVLNPPLSKEANTLHLELSIRSDTVKSLQKSFMLLVETANIIGYGFSTKYQDWINADPTTYFDKNKKVDFI